MGHSGDKAPFTAEIQYLVKDPKHDHEKPYYIYYAHGDAIPPTNTENDPRQVAIHNARSIEISPEDMFFEFGFAKMNFASSLPAEDYFDSARVVEALYPKCLEIVRSLFPDATRIDVLEHGARSRDPQYPASGLERYQYSRNQPSDYTHIDYTASSAERSAGKRFGIQPGQYSRIVSVNLWKPIKGPVYDWPLTLCDRRTVNHSAQTIPMDIVTQTYVNENTRIYHSDAHKWYYWEAMTENEVLVFMQSDSDADNAGVPHTAFQHPQVPENGQLRQSIEFRVFAYFQ